jgi:sn-glycerol 3-phosphate transport system permease protein
VAFPLYVTFVASTLTLEQIMQVPMPLVPGDQFWGELLAGADGAGTHSGRPGARGR